MSPRAPQSLLATYGAKNPELSFSPLMILFQPTAAILRSRDNNGLLTTMARSSRYLTPVSSSPLLKRCPGCLRLRPSQSRTFSAASTHQAMMVAQKSQASTKQMETRRSKKMQMKKLTANKIPEDVGLLPQTFIRPPNREMPRLFGAAWTQRLKLELCWVRTRLQNFGSYVDSSQLAHFTHLLLTPHPSVCSTLYTGPNASSPVPRNYLLTYNPALPSPSPSTSNSTLTSPPATSNPSATSSSQASPIKAAPKSPTAPPSKRPPNPGRSSATPLPSDSPSPSASSLGLSPPSSPAPKPKSSPTALSPSPAWVRARTS
jgi:hypothetical protein